MSRISRATIAVGLAAATALSASATVEAATTGTTKLRKKLGRIVAQAGPQTGAVVLDAKSGRVLVKIRAGAQRPLASNTKLFTTAAALRGLPPPATTVLSLAPPNGAGQVAGNLFVRGGGDPSLDTAAMNAIAGQVVAAGVTSITGGVIGDENLFDDLRGGPTSGFAFGSDIGGSLGALTFDRGRAVEGGSFLDDPARGAAARFDDALEARGVVIPGVPAEGAVPAGAATTLGSGSSTIAALSRRINKLSDNFFAEILAKGLGARGGSGTTVAGAASIEEFARGAGVGAELTDGSGLSRSNRAAPIAVARLLEKMRKDSAFVASLPIAGVDGTLAGRLGSRPAKGRCQAKTGSISRVSTLSGYCRARKRRLVFSLLFDSIDKGLAQRVQDEAVQAIAGSRP